MDWKDIVTRAGWTFVEAFCAAYILLPKEELTLDAVRSCGIAGAAAVISFFKTVATQLKQKGAPK